MWGGHSCPPLLTLKLDSTTARKQPQEQGQYPKRRTRVSAPHHPRASRRSPTVLPPEIPEQIGRKPVFMNEGRRVLAGEAILSGAATIERDSNDRSKNDRTERECSRVEDHEAVLE